MSTGHPESRNEAEEAASGSGDALAAPEVSLYGEQLLPGAFIDGYVVEAQVAGGGFSELYRVRDESTGRLAALKLLRPEIAAARQFRRRFQLEAQALLNLRHPNIVEMRTAGELRDGRPYMVMEWLSGRELLAEINERGAFAPREALAVMEQVAAALTVAHEDGIIHRDLKAANVMVVATRPSLQLKLIDFGVAKVLDPTRDGASPLTRSGVVLGTPVCMAPEQIRSEALDVRTDVYACGILLFQLLTGRLPFTGTTRAELEELHLHAPPPVPSALVPVAPALDQIVLRCLAKVRTDRYPTVAALMEDLRAAIDAGGEAQRPAEVPACACYVQVFIDEEQEDLDAAMDRAELLLDRAREEAALVGSVVTIDTANALLYSLPLGDDPAEVRTRLAASATRLLQDVNATDAVAGIRATLCLHEGTLKLVDGRPAGGTILRFADWAPGPQYAGRVLVTRAAQPAFEDFLRTTEAPRLPLRELSGSQER